MLKKLWLTIPGLFLISCTSALPQLSPQPSPEAVASAMVDVVLPADWVGAFDNLKELSSDQNNEITSKLKDAVGKVAKPSGMQEFLSWFRYPAYIRPLFSKGLLQNDKAKQYTTRLENLESNVFDEYKAALKTAFGVTSPDWVVAYGMAQIDSLWVGDAITQESKKHTLARLTSIPVATLDEWSEGSGEKGDTVTYLLRTEALFIRDKFDVELFRKALPIARQKYKERSQAQDASIKAKSQGSK